MVLVVRKRVPDALSTTCQAPTQTYDATRLLGLTVSFFVFRDAMRLTCLPLGYNSHWTRNILASPDGRKLYVTVGSASNGGEYGLDTEIRRANILEINLDGSGERIFASGLRNRMGWHGSRPRVRSGRR
jgi:hypothetical protein